MGDCLWSGRHFRLLNILDDFNREILAMEVDLSLPSPRVIRVLDFLELVRRLPKTIRWTKAVSYFPAVGSVVSGKGHRGLYPVGKAGTEWLLERCNGPVQKELLNTNVFNTLEEVKEKLGRLSSKTPWVTRLQGSMDLLDQF